MVYDISIERDDISRLLGKGLPEGCLFTIIGESSTGKSIWSQRISYGLCENNYSVLYFSGEDNSRTIVDQTESLGYDFQPYMSTGQLTFMSLGGRKKEMDVEPTDLLKPTDELDSDFVVIDGFGEILSRTTNSHQEQVRNFLKYIDNIKRTKNMSFLITSNPLYLDDTTRELLSSRSTIHSVVSNQTVADSTTSTLDLLKYKRPNSEFSDSLSFDVRYGEGIYESPSEYI